MTNRSHPLRLSVLDASPIPEGSDVRAALRNSVELARQVEALGYHRYWVPEHHGMQGVASAAPAVLAGHIASATQRIRVGAGGVMLPNHSPIVVAEQFGTLEALHPGRIDLGLGRAPGGPAPIADRLRGPEARTKVPFDDQVIELLALFDDGDEHAAAVPAAGNRPEFWMLGSSGHTARIAGHLGLAFAAAHHLKPQNTVEAVSVYRRAFRPSPLCAAPRISISVSAIVAESSEQAAWLAGSLRMKAASRRDGKPIRLPDPDSAAAHGYAAAQPSAEEPTSLVVGTPSTVLSRLQALVRTTGADELHIKTDTYHPEDRHRSYELLAKAASGWEVSGRRRNT